MTFAEHDELVSSVMSEHDSEAPTPDALPARPWLAEETTRRRLRHRGLAVAAVIVLVLVLGAVMTVVAGRSAKHPLSRAKDATIGADRAVQRARANPLRTACATIPTSTRVGTDQQLVPDGAADVTLCRNQPSGGVTSTVTSNIAGLTSALDMLINLTPNPAGCTKRSATSLPARGTWELHFHYPSGPDVLVNVLPECRPSLNNTVLAADSPTTIIPLLRSLTGQAVTSRAVVAKAIQIAQRLAAEAHVTNPTTAYVLTSRGDAFRVLVPNSSESSVNPDLPVIVVAVLGTYPPGTSGHGPNYSWTICAADTASVLGNGQDRVVPDLARLGTLIPAK